jgi:hypothetical protein
MTHLYKYILWLFLPTFAFAQTTTPMRISASAIYLHYEIIFNFAS